MSKRPPLATLNVSHDFDGNARSIDKFSDLKTLNISTETKIYRHSWKQRDKISITAKFEEEIL